MMMITWRNIAALASALYLALAMAPVPMQRTCIAAHLRRSNLGLTELLVLINVGPLAAWNGGKVLQLLIAREFVSKPILVRVCGERYLAINIIIN
jgi:hypothetical protein